MRRHFLHELDRHRLGEGAHEKARHPRVHLHVGLLSVLGEASLVPATTSASHRRPTWVKRYLLPLPEPAAGRLRDRRPGLTDTGRLLYSARERITTAA